MHDSLKFEILHYIIDIFSLNFAVFKLHLKIKMCIFVQQNNAKKYMAG